MKLVQDKITIITGGTRGIGFAAAKIFIENGAKVSIFGETQEEVDTALAQLKELYPEEEVLGFAPDLTSRDAVMAAGFDWRRHRHDAGVFNRLCC